MRTLAVRIAMLLATLCVVAPAPSIAGDEGAEGTAPDGGEPTPPQPPAEPTPPQPPPGPVPGFAVATPPSPIVAPEVPFPPEAVTAGVEGPVVLELSIDAGGAVVEGRVLASPGHGLGEAALAAVRATPFDPGLDAAGSPVAVAPFFYRIVLDSPDVVGLDPIVGTPGPDLTRPPEISRFVEAPYPAEAAASGIAGGPVLQIDVDEYGRVMDVRLATAAGHGFDAEAIRAAWQFEFRPGLAGEVPVAVTITYVYHFELRAPPPPEPPGSGDAAAGGIPADAPVNFAGTVRERGERTPLANVEVLIEGLDRVAMTDGRGHFEFRGVPDGIWNVLIATPGFERFRTEEQVRPGEATEVTYYVRPTPRGGNRTVVRVKQERKEVARRTLEIATLERIPGTFGDPIKAVQNMPGVARSPFDFGLLLVRGSAPEDTSINVDGVRVPLIYHFGGLRSVISPVLIDSIDFLPGGYGITYGRSTGGALDVKSRMEFPKEVHGLVRLDFIDGEAAVTGPLPRKGDPTNPMGGFAVAARRSYLDVILPAIAPPELDLSRTTLPRWWDAQGKVQLQPGPDARFGWFGYYSDDAAGIYSEDPVNPGNPDTSGQIDTAIRFTRQMLYADLRPTPRLRLTANVAYGWDYTLFNVTQAFKLDSSSHSVTGRVDAYGDVAPWLTVHGGLDGIVGAYDFSILLSSFDQQSGFDDPNAEREPLLVEGSDSGGGVAGYVEGILRPLGDRLTLLPGVRLDYYAVPGVFSALTVDPRFSFRAEVVRGTTLKGSVGLYHQNPQPFEWVEGTGNPDLHPERSFQVTFGVEQRFTDFLRLDVDLFYKRLSELVVPVFFEDDLTGGTVIWDNRGDGYIYGGELLLELKPWKGFQGWIAYTYQRSFRRDAPDDDWYRYDFDQPHILDVIARYDLPWELSVGLRFRLVSGNPYTTQERLLYDVDAFSYQAISGEYNAERMPTFHQLDLRVDKQFRFRTWKLLAYVEILNLYNQRNVEQATYNFDYSEQAWIYSLPFLPNLGLRVDF